MSTMSTSRLSAANKFLRVDGPGTFFQVARSTTFHVLRRERSVGAAEGLGGIRARRSGSFEVLMSRRSDAWGRDTIIQKLVFMRDSDGWTERCAEIIGLRACG